MARPGIYRTDVEKARRALLTQGRLEKTEKIVR